MGNNTEIFDGDLNPVLEIAPREDLQFLVDLLTGDFNNDLAAEEAYRKYSPDHTRYADLIAREIREFGGHSVANLLRGSGPAYKDIVADVAVHLRVPFNAKQPIEAIENAILAVVLEKSLDAMNDAEKHILLQEIGGEQYGITHKITGPAFAATAIKVFHMGGFTSYKLAVIAASSIAKMAGISLSLGINAGLTKALSILAGPVGIALTALWTGYDLGGAAYRITAPAVVYIAMLRKKYNTPEIAAARFCADCGEALPEKAKFCPACGAKVE